MTNSQTATVPVYPGEPAGGLRRARLRRACGPGSSRKSLSAAAWSSRSCSSGVLAPWISPYDPNLQNLGQALVAPQWLGGSHFLGTDQVGTRHAQPHLLWRAHLIGDRGHGRRDLRRDRRRARRDFGLFRGWRGFRDPEACGSRLGLPAAAAGHRDHGVFRPGARHPHLRAGGATMDSLLPGGTRPGAVAAERAISSTPPAHSVRGTAASSFATSCRT